MIGCVGTHHGYGRSEVQGIHPKYGMYAWFSMLWSSESLACSYYENGVCLLVKPLPCITKSPRAQHLIHKEYQISLHKYFQSIDVAIQYSGQELSTCVFQALSPPLISPMYLSSLPSPISFNFRAITWESLPSLHTI